MPGDGLNVTVFAEDCVGLSEPAELSFGRFANVDITLPEGSTEFRITIRNATDGELDMDQPVSVSADGMNFPVNCEGYNCILNLSAISPVKELNITLNSPWSGEATAQTVQPWSIPEDSLQLNGCQLDWENPLLTPSDYSLEITGSETIQDQSASSSFSLLDSSQQNCDSHKSVKVQPNYATGTGFGIEKNVTVPGACLTPSCSTFDIGDCIEVTLAGNECDRVCFQSKNDFIVIEGNGRCTEYNDRKLGVIKNSENNELLYTTCPADNPNCFGTRLGCTSFCGNSETLKGCVLTDSGVGCARGVDSNAPARCPADLRQFPSPACPMATTTESSGNNGHTASVPSAPFVPPTIPGNGNPGLQSNAEDINSWPWWGKTIFGTGVTVIGSALLITASCLLKKAWNRYRHPNGQTDYQKELYHLHKRNQKQAQNPPGDNPQPSAPPFTDLGGGSAAAMQGTPMMVAPGVPDPQWQIPQPINQEILHNTANPGQGGGQSVQDYETAHIYEDPDLLHIPSLSPQEDEHSYNVLENRAAPDKGPQEIPHD